MAKSRSDRYEQELIAEMDRNTALARQSARLREENTALKEELRTAKLCAATSREGEVGHAQLVSLVKRT